MEICRPQRLILKGNDKFNVSNFVFRLFFEKSQNRWGYDFEKVPGGMELIEMEVDDNEANQIQTLDPADSKSLLPIQTRSIISLFFDIELMIKQMAEFEVKILFLIKLHFSSTLTRCHWRNFLPGKSDVPTPFYPSCRWF